MFKQTDNINIRLSLSLSSYRTSFMCLISGDSIVGAAPSPKLSPRPGRRCSGPRANLGSHARSLCTVDEAAASFEIDKTINNDIIEVKCLVSQSCLSYIRSITTAFDGSR
jgi:hypothetical protein